MTADFSYALRQLRKSPGFALTAILTLALGIGANTAIFSVMHAVLLRMLPVREPAQLFYLTHENSPDNVGNTGNQAYTFGVNVYNRLRADRSVLSDLVAYVPLSFSRTAVRAGDQPEEIFADEVSGNFFSGLGVPMAAGQAFASADEDHHSPVAVISYGYWSRRFGRDPGAIGQPIYINGVAMTIIGVTAPGFEGIETGGNATDLWIPLQNRPELNAWGVPATGNTLYGSPNWWNLMFLARLRPGVTQQQALARLSPLFEHAAWETVGQEVKGARAPLGLALVAARGLGPQSQYYEQPLHVLMGMVALVLVIACVNIAMLLAARNAAREREFSMRLALGAGRWPLFRQLLAESLLLVGSGSLLGWGFAVEATRLLARWSQMEVSLAPDTAVLFFTLAVAGAAALLFGLAPLRSAVSAPVSLVLRSTSTQTTASRSRMLSGKILLSAQIAFCVALLFAAGLLIRTLRNYQKVDLGIRASQVLAFGVHPIGARNTEQTLGFYNQLMRRIEALPGVEAATVAENRPGSGWTDNDGLTIDGRRYPWDNGRNMLRSNTVGPRFFETLGIPLIAGRSFNAADTRSTAPVAVVNQTLADRYFKGSSPLGHTLGSPKRHMIIVGLVRDNKYNGADEPAMPMAWYCFQQDPSLGSLDVEVRAAGDPMRLLPEIRRIVREMDPNAPLQSPLLLRDQFAQTWQMPALFARLGAFFGALAALLVAVGLYGTLAWRVNRRTVEIGVRMALGAARGQVLWMILGDSLVLVAAGLAVGLPLAWFGSHLMASMLFRLPVHDPVSFAAAALGIVLVSLAAALLPARRAASVEPMQALRND